MHLRELGVVLVLRIRIALLVGAGQDGVVGQFRIFKKSVDRIKAEAGDAAFVPPPRGVEHGFLKRRIAPVQIRLLGVEVVIVVLLGGGIEFPCRPTEKRNPVVGRLSRSLAVAPDVPVAMGRRPRRFRIDKPWVLVGAVIYNKVEDDSHALLLPLRDHSVEVSERSIHRINVLVVGDVITEIYLRRGKARADPDCVHSQVVQVGHLRSDPFKVANSVVVAVGVAPRIDLVEDSVLPPLVAFGVARFRLRVGLRDSGNYTSEDNQERENRKESL